MQNGKLYWITGLSGAGKTTIGKRLFCKLKQLKDNVVILDGDELKVIVDDVVGYSNEERKKRAMKYARLCSVLTSQGIDVVCCTISMYDEIREWNRKNIPNYVEVFLNVPMKILYERNQKGLYSGLDSNKVKNVSGVDLNVEFPKNPDITIINDGKESIDAIVDNIFNYSVK